MQAQTTPWHFGMSTYTNYSFPIYIPQPETEWMVDLWKDVEQPKLSFGANIFAEYSIGERIGLSLGLGYLNYGERTSLLTYGNYQFKNIYACHAVEIPLTMRYYFKNGIYVSAGASLLAQIAYKRTLWLQEGNESPSRETKDVEEAELRAMNFALSTAIGYTFLRQKKVNLFVAAKAQYVAFGIMQDVPLNRKYISAGIEVGVRF